MRPARAARNLACSLEHLLLISFEQLLLISLQTPGGGNCFLLLLILMYFAKSVCCCCSKVCASQWCDMQLLQDRLRAATLLELA